MIDRVLQALSANNNSLKTTLHKFSSSGDVEAIQSLLENNKDLNINISSKGKNTALHSALSHNQQGLVIDYLISQGANVDAFNSKGYSCIILAIINCQPGVQALEKLMRAGATWNGTFQRGKFSGLTALDIAEQSKNADAINLLKRMSKSCGSHKVVDGKDKTNKASKNHGICPICKISIKFPTKLSFIERDQQRAEANALERHGKGLEKSSTCTKRQIKEIYTCRKYLDEFLTHSNGATFKKLCGIEYHGIANKGKLRKEISESYSILHAVQDCCTKLGLIPSNNSSHLQYENTFLIDLCAGKSLTTALCGALFPPNGHGENKFLAVDKLPVHLVPHFLQDGNTAYLSRNIMSEVFLKELEQESNRQTSQGKTTILVGMHLCGNLSERAINLFERIPSIKALVLCPCCLPKLRKKSEPSAFDKFLVKRQEKPSYMAWSNYLEQKVEKVNTTKMPFPVCSYTDDSMHTIKNSLITAVRK